MCASHSTFYRRTAIHNHWRLLSDEAWYYRLFMSVVILGEEQAAHIKTAAKKPRLLCYLFVVHIALKCLGLLKYKSCSASSMLLFIAGIEVRKTGARGEHNFPFFPNELLKGYGFLKKFIPR
jgi:hypothetical protein